MTNHRRTRRLAGLVLLGAFAASCASGVPGKTERTERIVLNDLAFAPNTLTFPANTTVRFTLVNQDTVDHEFVVGSEAVQQEHAMKAAQGDHGMHDPTRAAVPAGKTVEFSYTFGAPAMLMVGCHVAGHYALGMRGTITITP